MNHSDRQLRIGTAGWSIPAEHAAHFPASGTHLERYASVFPAVEINSSFHRSHGEDVYARWAEAVPPEFQFAVKLPKEITHFGRLTDVSGLDEFLRGPRALGPKLRLLLVQLPPSLPFAAETATRFFHELRDRHAGGVVCEPRHASWFGPAAEELLSRARISRAAADPAPAPPGAAPGGWDGLAYYRLHGTPHVYYSAYPPEYLHRLIPQLHAAARQAPVWCIFDNTARGAATGNALALREAIRAPAAAT